MNISLIEQTLWRFIQAGLYGALSTASVVTYYTGVQTWEQFHSASNALILSALIGFITGVFMALHKYYLTGSTIPLSGLV